MIIMKRPMERIMAWFAMALGAWLLLPPASFASSGFSGVVARADEWQWGLLFFMAGALHAFAVHVNGRAWWTPFYRAITAAMLAFMWGYLAFGIATVNLWSTGVLVYLCLAGGAARALRAAAGDCKSTVEAWRGHNA